MCIYCSFSLLPCHLIARNNNSNVRVLLMNPRIKTVALYRYMYTFFVIIYAKNRYNSSRRFPTPRGAGVRLIGLDNREKLKDISSAVLFHFSFLFFFCLRISRFARDLCFSFVASVYNIKYTKVKLYIP